MGQRSDPRPQRRQPPAHVARVRALELLGGSHDSRGHLKGSSPATWTGPPPSDGSSAAGVPSSASRGSSAAPTTGRICPSRCSSESPRTNRGPASGVDDGQAPHIPRHAGQRRVRRQQHRQGPRGQQGIGVPSPAGTGCRGCGVSQRVGADDSLADRLRPHTPAGSPLAERPLLKHVAGAYFSAWDSISTRSLTPVDVGTPPARTVDNYRSPTGKDWWVASVLDHQPGHLRQR